MITDTDAPFMLPDDIRPFLKWAGGKRWLATEIKKLIPTDMSRYVEPFLGGAAVFFAVQPSYALLSDANQELIEAYEGIKQDWQGVWDRLEWHQKRHCAEHYYLQRSSKETFITTKAARFIYLNRACWNGLYRVNLKGEFNVPKGSKERVIFDYDDFAAIANALSSASLCHSDFEVSIDQCGDGDFLFIDPPYTVKHNMNGFVKYNENLFSWEDQVRLRDCLVRAAERGAEIVVTNADHHSIRNLYKGVGNLRTVRRNSVLSADSRYRGEVTELLIALPKKRKLARCNSTLVISKQKRWQKFEKPDLG